MPPVGFWAAATSSYASATGAITFLTPAAVRENDVLYAFIAQPTGTPVAPTGWTLVQTFFTTPNVYAFRRIAIADEPAAHVFTTTVALTPQPIGILALYRGVAPTGAFVTPGFTVINPTSTAYVAPSINLTTYSDLGVLLYYALDAAGTDSFTMPGGVTQRAIVHGSSGGETLVLADYLAGATGATGTKTATAATTSVGLAVNIGIKANPTLPAGALVPDVPGAIGLPMVGV